MKNTMEKNNNVALDETMSFYVALCDKAAI
jgi:hypothetical protein